MKVREWEGAGVSKNMHYGAEMCSRRGRRSGEVNGVREERDARGRDGEKTAGRRMSDREKEREGRMGTMKDAESGNFCGDVERKEVESGARALAGRGMRTADLASSLEIELGAVERREMGRDSRGTVAIGEVERSGQGTDGAESGDGRQCTEEVQRRTGSDTEARRARGDGQ
ncbi:hypothetical protein C8R44DRAFT_863380 [Mycena epipterygia]|nr:hypothetical protein C8R44DRAFT_863380 [Mycena epipterygia]